MLFDKDKRVISFANGHTVPCDSVDEAREICHQLVEYARLFGHIKPHDSRRSIPYGVVRGRCEGKEKRVRIHIEADEKRDLA